MRVPAFNSEHYRRLGWKPVFWCGLVLWLTPSQYDKVKVLDVDGKLADATEEQIAAQDRWRDDLLTQEQNEAEEFARYFRRGS